MNCPEINLTVTMIFSRALQIAVPSIEVRPSPTTMPSTRATINLNGRLDVKPFSLIKIHL